MVLKSPPVDFVLQERTVGFLAASVFSVAYVAAPIHVARNKWWSRENPWGWIYCGSIWDMMGGHWISPISQPYHAKSRAKPVFLRETCTLELGDPKMGDFTKQRHRRREVFCALGCTVRYPTWWGAWMMNIPLLGAS